MSRKILIIGAGSIGTRHLKNLLKLGYKNLAVCDPDEKRIKAVSELGNFSLYKNTRAALKKERPEIVFVCNPTHLHVPTASLALDAGAHVFIEKPLAANLIGVDLLIRLAQKKKLTAMVACNFRFHLGFKELKEVLRQKRFGKPVLVRVKAGFFLPTARKNSNYKKIFAAHRHQGGGVVLDLGSHLVDYLKELFGPIIGISGLAAKTNILGIAAEEAASLIFRHKKGVLTSVNLDYLSQKPMHQLEVVTFQGLLTLDFRKNRLIFEDRNRKKVIYQGNKDINAMYILELKHFFDCLKRHKAPLQNLQDAKETLKVLLKIKV